MKIKGSMGRILQGPRWLVEDLEKIQGFVFSKQKLCGPLKETLEMLKSMKEKAKGEVQSSIFIFVRRIMYEQALHYARRSHERIEITRTITKDVKKCLTILLQ
jgi:hypothetical protein